MSSHSISSAEFGEADLDDPLVLDEDLLDDDLLDADLEDESSSLGGGARPFLVLGGDDEAGALHAPRLLLQARGDAQTLRYAPDPQRKWQR